MLQVYFEELRNLLHAGTQALLVMLMLTWPFWCILIVEWYFHTH